MIVQLMNSCHSLMEKLEIPKGLKLPRTKRRIAGEKISRKARVYMRPMSSMRCQAILTLLAPVINSTNLRLVLV
ncbi:hypothetical protein ACFX14_000700 [Malus domestica]